MKKKEKRNSRNRTRKEKKKSVRRMERKNKMSKKNKEKMSKMRIQRKTKMKNSMRKIWLIWTKKKDKNILSKMNKRKEIDKKTEK